MAGAQRNWFCCQPVCRQEEKHAICPEGHVSNSWTPALDRRKNEVIKMKFSTKDCTGCPSQAQCTYTGHAPRRTLTIRPHEHILRFNKPEPGKKLLTLLRSMCCEKGLRVRSLKEFERWDCGAPVMLGKRKRISSIFFQRWQPISFASCNGGQGLPGRKLGLRVLLL
jgi:hypothetical protein